MGAGNTESPENQDNQNSLDNLDDKELNVLLLEYKQSRIDIRRYIAQQGRIITGTVAVIGALSGYAVQSSGSDYFSSPIVAIIPFVVGLMAILSLEIENNAVRMRNHRDNIRNRIIEKTNLNDFGHGSLKESSSEININGKKVDWNRVPLLMIWSITFLYFALHILFVIVSLIPNSPIQPILQSTFSTTLLSSGYLIVLAMIVLSLYSRSKVRDSDD